MLSNHIVMPVALRGLAAGRAVKGDFRHLLLVSRRVCIAVALGLGFLYFRLSGGSDALAAIGLIAFVGVAQLLPSLVGGIFWRGGTRTGALSGLLIGFALWAYTLFLPSFGGDVILSAEVLRDGPGGIGVLRPQGLLGLTVLDPLVHAVVWSVGMNALAFVVVSSLGSPGALERLQATLFVDAYRAAGGAPSSVAVGPAASEDLFLLARRILGDAPARDLFDEMATAQGLTGGLPYPTDAVIARLERELSGSIGAASAHALVNRIADRQSLGTTELIDIADETQQMLETAHQLAEKSAELERTAEKLRAANERLRTLDALKDEFLGQLSHELRTPMTSIRSFSEILMDDAGVSDGERRRFVSIINEESQRLTRLLDELLDISRLEGGTIDVRLETIEVREAIGKALAAASGMTQDAGVAVTADSARAGLRVRANPDRLRQVLINLLSNAVKYNTAPRPEIRLRVAEHGPVVGIDIADNGGGVTRAEAATIFEKFARGDRADRSHGAGLGLPISRAIMRAMNGDLAVEFAPDGTSFFRLRLPRADT